MTAWLPVLLDGSVGAAVGSIGSFAAAVWVVKRQSQADRQLFRAQQKIAAAAQLTPELVAMFDSLAESRGYTNPEAVEAVHHKIGKALGLQLVRAAQVSPGIAKVVGETSRDLEEMHVPSEWDEDSRIEWARAAGAKPAAALHGLVRELQSIVAGESA